MSVSQPPPRRDRAAARELRFAELVDAEPVREHLRELIAAGMKANAIAAAAGVSPQLVYILLKTQVSAPVAAALLGVRPHAAGRVA